MQQDTGIDPDSLRVLSMLSEKQRDCALTLYANREKKKSLAYVFWIVGAVYYFYLDRPARNTVLWILWFVIVGFVWWIVDLFPIGRMVEERNKEVIEECMREAVRIYPDPVSMSPENVVTIDNEV